MKELNEGEVCMFLALMKDGTACPVPKGILIGVDDEHEELYIANLNMHPVESHKILNIVANEFE
jgi:hypothetical protein